MKTFRYKAADTSGKIVSGDMAAADRAALFDKLQQTGLTLIDARSDEAGTGGFIEALTRARGGRYSRRDLAHFFRSLSTFLKSGVTIDRSLRLFAKLRGGTRIGALSARAADELRAGRSFAAVLEAEAGALPPFIVPMVETGEISARIADMTAEIAGLLESQQAVEDEIVTALTYPAILLATALIAVVVITTIVLPQFEPLFARADASLPWISSVFLGVAHGLRQYGVLVLILLLLAGAGLLAALRRPDFRRRLDTALLGWPLIGPLVAKVELGRFFRGFGLLLGAGVSLPRALQIARKGTRNGEMADLFAEAEARVREGEALSAVFAGRPHVPSLVAEFLTVAEESGQIGPISNNLAGLMAADVSRFTERFLRVLSPAITIGLGLFVAGLVASILLALLSLNDLAL